MLLPIGTDRPLKRPTLLTYVFIGLNIAVFLGEVVLRRASGGANDADESFVTKLWLNPELFRWWSLVTYQFLHADAAHIFGNMMFLYVFGPNVEDRLGRIGFGAFYLLGGAAAGGIHALFAEPPNPVIGASGAIAAVTGAYFVLFPRTNIRVLVLFFVIGVFEWPATWFLGLAMAKDVFLHSIHAAGEVAVLAHIGGYVFGIAVSLLLLAMKIIPRETYDLFSIGKHAHRRRKFKELATSGRTAWRHEAGQSIDPSKSGVAPVDPEVAALRTRAITSAGSGRLDDACEAYRRLLERAVAPALPRDTQLAIGNHLAGLKQYPAAAEAYETFLKRFGADREATHIRLMLALIKARYLGDRARAGELIAEVKRSSDAVPHADMIELLSREIG
ncbi:MAG TPA: rhomboid family intramembrane serine protease [Phycisphaerales bacterium]|nr:rhomboid family intramembrane serine protease [Phycisphaerales bacterium]